MKIKASDLRDAIGIGVSSVQSRLMQLTKDRGEAPHPEYLTTTTVGLHLCSHFDDRQLNLVVRFEEPTGAIWRAGEVRALLNRKASAEKEHVRELRAQVRNLTRRGSFGWRKRLANANRRLRDADRAGNIDIAIFKGDGFEHPFAIVENKGVLTFADNGHLYVASKAELDKDIKRNAHYVSKHSAAGGIQFSAFTFYLKDKGSVTEADAQAYRSRMRKYFSDHLETLNLDGRIQSDVMIETWDHELAKSHQHAQELDKVGELNTWHIAYGVITLYVAGDDIGDELRLSA
jgi:hypothetical protein